MNNNDIIAGFDDEKDDSLKIRLQKVDGLDKCVVVFLNGYIDTYNSAFFQKKVFLQLYVKVEKDWRNRENKLRNFGYTLSHKQS